MKTTLFSGDQLRPLWNASGGLRGINVPTLDAYAVEYAELIPPRHLDYGHTQLTSASDFSIQGSEVLLQHPIASNLFGLSSNISCRLTVHYHGIRDHRLLFPQIRNHDLRSRLAEFYAEADLVFDTGAWLSFTLLASAIYEGLLGWRLNDFRSPFSSLIKAANGAQIIDAAIKRILESAKDARNLVHASKFDAPLGGRHQAMDVRITLDRLIRTLSRTEPR